MDICDMSGTAIAPHDRTWQSGIVVPVRECGKDTRRGRLDTRGCTRSAAVWDQPVWTNSRVMINYVL